MKVKQIQFIAPGIAALNHVEIPSTGPGMVLLKTVYTVVSAGTEYANLMGMRNTNPNELDMIGMKFPKVLGYCGVGIVEEIGERVSSVQPGDRAIIYFGTHTAYNLVPEEKVIKITDDTIDLLQLAPTVIAQISMGGVRMARVELGESAIVMGLGILGMYAIQWLKLSGACPIIAVDPIQSRRDKALTLGADYALNPTSNNFIKEVLMLTKDKGVQVGIEVSGASVALVQMLECTARMARVVLLGCTRVNDYYIDFYHKVHARGIKLLGAHTCVRPDSDSYPGYWTYRDEIEAVLNMVSLCRIDLAKNIEEIRPVQQASQIYARLAENNNFPSGLVLDWRTID